jgi:hypothetical protein
MRLPARFPKRLARLALLLPLALACAPEGGDAAPGADAATSAALDAGGSDTSGAPEPAPRPSLADRSPEELQEIAANMVRGLTGVILRATPEQIAVRNLSEGTGGSTWIELSGGPDTPVSGEKKSFDALRPGDLVAVAYQGVPPRAVGVRVITQELNPQLAASAFRDPYKKRGREFTGWIKQIDAETMVVRTPNGPLGRVGEIKTFSRHDATVVELLRDSWDDLKKGDRVTVIFRKGEPRPADRIKVVLRGGEKPLPRGLATQLFDPAYDHTVKDVDGIGEWPPDQPWPPGAQAQDPPAAAPAS